MSDMPRTVEIAEEGPRKGLQIEKGKISSTDKIALIDALSLTGVRRIQVASFVNPKLVPSWADAETAARSFANFGIEGHQQLINLVRTRGKNDADF